MFVDNKYTKWYYNIVANALARTTVGYKEKHHIIPKSLGGADDMSNLVVLTAREHFICHWLLVKCTSGNAKEKMIYALNGMRRSSKNHERYETKITAKVYETVRKESARLRSEAMKGRTPWNKGKVCPEISLANKGRPNPNKGKPSKNKGKTAWNKGLTGVQVYLNKGKQGHPAWNKGMTSPKKGTTLSEETKAKMRKPRGKQELVTCPHCAKTGGVSNMTRWHFNNCKQLNTLS